ncbi:MAG TPA: hypothetical protein DCE56_11540 [Cyanobacteria bacterium UBA8553]|nr:hypothetical protein [Cyanobacteria bacterium UBA8553]
MISVLILFGMVEIYQWMKHFTVPLPVFLLGGALLAIASNYRKFTGWFLQQQPTLSDANQGQIPPLGELTNTQNYGFLDQASATPAFKPARSISFMISRPESEQVRKDLRS